MANTSQLIKENKSQGGYNKVYPKTFIDAIKDRETGQTLSDILNGFNMYFLSYVESKEQTRLQVPKFLRRKGLVITYITYEGIIATERYKQESIDDATWKNGTNWDNLYDTNDYVRINNSYGFNVTVFGTKGGRHSIETAILDVPSEVRMLGQKIVFAQQDGTWATYQLQSMSLSDFTKPEKWVKLEGITTTENISIINQPDEEDITVDSKNLLKFADKEYSENSFSGLGRVYLRKNLVEVDNGSGIITLKNILTQNMISKENTEYIIQYDYDLDGKTINIPYGSSLKFKNGSIQNGYISGYIVHIYIYVDDCIGNTDDDKIKNAITLAKNLYIKNNIYPSIIFGKKEYDIYNTINLPVYIRLRTDNLSVTINDYTNEGAIYLTDDDLQNNYDSAHSRVAIINNFSFINKTSKIENIDGKYAIKIYYNTPAINTIFTNIAISNYDTAFNIESINFWRNRFNNINIQNCYIGFYFNKEAVNSGENILINDSLLSNNNCAIYIGSNSLKIRIINSSIDYNGICVYSPDTITNFNIEFNKCWIEGNGSRTAGIDNNKGIAKLNTTVGDNVLNYNVSILKFIGCEIIEKLYYIYPQIKADNNAILVLSNNIFYLQNSVIEENANLNASNFNWYFVEGFKKIHYTDNIQKVNTTLKLSKLYNIIPENDLDDISIDTEITETKFFNIINKHNIDSIKLVEESDFNNVIKCIKITSSVINDGQQSYVDFESKDFYLISNNIFAANIIMKNRLNTDDSKPINYYTCYIDCYDCNYNFINSSTLSTNFSVNNITWHGATNVSLQNVDIPINAMYFKLRIRLMACAIVTLKGNYVSYLSNFMFINYTTPHSKTYKQTVPLIGDTNSRPIFNTKLNFPVCYFDTTLNKPIYWIGTGWVDSTGTSVDS